MNWMIVNPLHQLFGQKKGTQVPHLEETGKAEKEDLCNAPPRHTIVDAFAEASEVLFSGL